MSSPDPFGLDNQLGDATGERPETTRRRSRPRGRVQAGTRGVVLTAGFLGVLAVGATAVVDAFVDTDDERAKDEVSRGPEVCTEDRGACLRFPDRWDAAVYTDPQTSARQIAPDSPQIATLFASGLEEFDAEQNLVLLGAFTRDADDGEVAQGSASRGYLSGTASLQAEVDAQRKAFQGAFSGAFTQQSLRIGTAEAFRLSHSRVSGGDRIVSVTYVVGEDSDVWVLDYYLERPQDADKDLEEDFLRLTRASARTFTTR